MRIVQITTDNREPTRDYTNPVPWFGTAPEALFQGFAELPGVEVHVLACTQQPMVSSPERLAPNVFFHSLHVPKLGWLRTAYQGCVRAVRQRIRELQPDLVHGQGTEREGAISAIFSGLPNVITIHGNMRLIAQVNKAPLLSYQWLSARLEEWIIPRSAGVVCLTEYTREAVQATARKTWVSPNAVDKSFFEIERKASPGDRPFFICVGFICLRKNQNRLIRALDELARQTPFTLRFFGSLDKGDPYADEFLSLVEERPWCEYPGMVDRAGLRAELGAATGLILASIEDNCPMVVLEAMAARTPVIAPAVGGVPELVTDGETGLLVNPESEEALSGAVRRILESEQMRQGLAANARMRAEKMYHPRVIAQQHVQIYEEVLASSRR